MKKIFALSIIVMISLLLSGCGGMNGVDKSWAEQMALKDISKDTIKTPTSAELKCTAKSKEKDDIILVKCTTSHEELKKLYKSETIWYGYLETADGKSYYHYMDNDKDKVLEMLRK